jgi:hypothetical protein
VGGKKRECRKVFGPAESGDWWFRGECCRADKLPFEIRIRNSNSKFELSIDISILDIDLVNVGKAVIKSQLKIHAHCDGRKALKTGTFFPLEVVGCCHGSGVGGWL